MENKNPKICLLGASFGTNNMGVNALTAGTIKSVFHQFPHAELFLLDYGRERTSHVVEIDRRQIVVQLENMRFSKKVYLRNNITMLLWLSLIVRLVPFGKLKKKLVSGNPCLKRLSEASFVISMAGGDSFSDIYGLERFFYVSLPLFLALFMRRRLVLLPQTIGPFKGTVAKNVARYILRKADLIYSRDYQGLDDTRNLLGSGSRNIDKIRFCYDMGFTLAPVRPMNMNLYFGAQERRERPVIGINVSGLLYMGGYSRNNMFELKVDYRDLIADLIDFMIRKKNATVVLIPHVFGTHLESDAVVCKQIYASLKERYNRRLLFATGTFNQNEIKYIIGLSDFFIGSRMHACIAALSQNIPTVSIAYSDKFIGVMQTIGVAELVADPRKLKKEEIFRIIDNAFEQRTLLRGQLEKTMPHVKETALNLFNEISSLLPSNTNLRR